MLNPGDPVKVAEGHKWAGAEGVVIGPSLVKPGRLVVRSSRTGGEIAFRPQDLLLIDRPALGDQPSLFEVPIEQAFPAPAPGVAPRCDQQTPTEQAVSAPLPSSGGLITVGDGVELPQFVDLLPVPVNYGDDPELAQFVGALPIPPIAVATHPETLADVILNSPIAIAALAITTSRQGEGRVINLSATSRQGDQRAIRIEPYENRAGTYYRLAWSEGHRKLTRHIPGGNIHSERVRDRVSRLTDCINQGGTIADCLKILRD
jgi:hypothetical protein